jgi:hypothetical protein
MYGVLMIALDQRPMAQLYSSSPYHRLQASALLDGHFHLAESIEGLQPGLAWHDGKVQQVWGLGVGLWLAPFQAVWILLSQRPFPDRIALGFAFALLAFYSSCTGLRLVRNDQRANGLALIWLITLCPAVWTLARNSRLIFEETVLYSVLLSLGVLISLLRVTVFGSRGDYIACCILGALAMWVRPTHTIYGLFAVLIASSIVWQRKGYRKLVACGLLTWATSLGLLVLTNNIRFGSPSEFGHRLTTSTGSMVYLTRFGNPFAEARIADASAELLGLLFFTRGVHDAAAFDEKLFFGQAAVPRWRRLDLPTFDLSYFLISLAAVIVTIGCLAKRRCNGLFSAFSNPESLNIVLLLWSGCAFVGLFLFYLHYPAIASRYILDFSPALFGLVLVFWILASNRWPRSALVALALWLTFEIISAKVPAREQTFYHSPAQEVILTPNPRFPSDDFQGIYTASRHPVETRIAVNGKGWEPGSGFAASIVTLVLDDPEFVELLIDERRIRNGAPASKDVYQAQIDGQSLPFRQMTRDGDSWKVVFDIPDSIKARQQVELLFLCFTGGYDSEDRNSERVMHSVRWK